MAKALLQALALYMSVIIGIIVIVGGVAGKM